MKITYQDVKDKMPYSNPFLFVEEFFNIDENGAFGTYKFKEDEYFYKGHFPGNPITPGVILIEVMAQIGLVGLGIYIFLKEGLEKIPDFAFASSDVIFLRSVLPGERVYVESEKIYFRFGKLKCKVVLKNEEKETVCKGTLTGMILK